MHAAVLPAFNPARRRVLIDRLLSDPAVGYAVSEAAVSRSVPRQIVLREAERYVREIVPAFNAYANFWVGYPLAQRCAEFMYRVRLGYVDDAALAALDFRYWPVNTGLRFSMKARRPSM